MKLRIVSMAIVYIIKLMNNRVLIIIGIIILILIAGWFYMNGNVSTSTQDQANNQNPSQPSSASTMTSLKDLLALGQSQMCTFNYPAEDTNMEGTSFIANGKVRTDFKGTDPGGASFEGSMINDGEYLYSWTSQMTQGFKLKLTNEVQESIDKENPEFTAKQNKYLDPNEKVDYKCQAWNADMGMFTPPSDISFMENTDETQKVQLESGDRKEAQCQACDNLPEGEGKTMCKQQLGC